jgi:hypothetical protein
MHYKGADFKMLEKVAAAMSFVHHVPTVARATVSR